MGELAGEQLRSPGKRRCADSQSVMDIAEAA